ncbi:MAG: HAMP domain-containing histidine kinase [Opitutaceae bacterium]|jgi:two-component system, OmpR family, sensor histidine kinase CpxA|nr:HAMP domain-containing histidine kinase [Opitutaceae bacterium]
MDDQTENQNPAGFRIAPGLRVPLSVKIGIWLGLNFLFIAAIAVGVLLGRGGLQGWIGGPVGDRLQLVGVAMNSAVRNGEDLESVIARYEEVYDLSFAFYSNEGELKGGATIPIPDEVSYILQNDEAGDGVGAPPRADDPRMARPGPGPGPPRRADDRRPPPDPRNRQPGDGPPRRQPPDAGPGGPRGMEGGGPSGRDGRIFEYDRSEGRWWVGVRAPVFDTEGRPMPGALFAISDSVWSFGGLLDLRPAVYAVAAVVVLSVIFWLPLVVGITRALRQATYATTEIAQGRFKVRVETNRRDELGLLGESINRMAERLDRLVNGQKKFLADVAHELGSPLGRLQVGAAILQDRVPDDLQDSVQDVQEEVQQMSDLLGELLAFTRAGLQARVAVIQPVVLRDAVDQAMRREAVGMDISIDVEAEVVVGGDANLLVKVLSNLVRNATRYAGADAKISIDAVHRAPDWVDLNITDDGPGVPPEALARLGEPFYRPDSARSRELGGTGLGLSIVRESIEAMGGKVSFANGNPRGFIAKIKLRQDHSRQS